ncbi:MAG: aldo/keto reductase [Candidatus Aenigmatarchaeota archaeon]
MNKIDKLILGTAQFGLNYGINNQRGKIPKQEVFEILHKATKFRIYFLDTAYSYGDSEKVIGEFIKTNPKNRLKIISKLPPCRKNNVENIVNTSLKRLGISKLYGYLIHSFESYREEPSIWDELEKVKQKGYIQKIGFSLYYPSELEFLFKKNIKLDILQIPYNIFDQRFESYFEEIKKRKIELYVRSIFLQGLVFKNLEELSKFFNPIKDKLQYLHRLSIEKNTSILSLCLIFAIRNKFIDKVIVGIDSLNQLNEIINSVNRKSVDEDTIQQLKQLRFDNEKIILPCNWPKNYKR